MSSVPDDRLRLIFTCCHPALARDAQVALTLRLLGGLTMAEIARAFLVDEAAMSKRLTRSKQKIKAAHIPYRVPPDHELPSRLAGVLATLYLVFNEGYLPSSPDVEVRTDLSAEAIRQARVLATLMPDEPEVAGPARPDAPDRGASTRSLRRRSAGDACRSRTARCGTPGWSPRGTTWSGPACAEGARVRTRSRRPSTRSTPTPRRAEATDWRQIVALYDQLYAVTPTPVVALNRAVALAERDGPTAGLVALEAVARARRLPRLPGRPGRPAAAGRPGRRRRSRHTGPPWS